LNKTIVPSTDLRVRGWASNPFWSAKATLAGIEIMHMIRKGQLLVGTNLSPAQAFYLLAA
jgi:hypothetical protein